jgi:hypothetical protein
MLISVFELLGDARQQIISVNAYIEALRDFWLTDSTLQLAMTGASPGAIGVPRGPGMQAVSGGIAEPGH